MAPDPGTEGPWSCDANAGTPVLPEVLDEFVAVERRCPGNPASVHAPGRAARAVLEAARDRIAQALGLAPVDVVFTSGGTEAANLAVHGLGDPQLPVLLAEVEHPAVREPAALRGCELWSVDPNGRVRVAPPSRPVGLVCLVHAQSELGTLQPVGEAADLAHQLLVPLFVDAAQTLGRVPLTEVGSRATALALSPHKAGGLRGFGVLAGRDLATRLRPLLRGGSQEQGLRPGTPSPALAAANALAIERAIAAQATRAAAMLSVRSAFLAGLAESTVAHQVLTPLAESVPNTAMVVFAAVDGRNLLPALDLAGVHASHGSACSSGAPTPPRILTAIGCSAAAARAAVRFSFDGSGSIDRWYRAGRAAGAVVLGRQKKS
jgi:cysteine desulfurase